MKKEMCPSCRIKRGHRKKIPRFFKMVRKKCQCCGKEWRGLELVKTENTK